MLPIRDMTDETELVRDTNHIQLVRESCPVWPHERFPTAEHMFNLHGAVAGTVSEFNVSL